MQYLTTRAALDTALAHSLEQALPSPADLDALLRIADADPGTAAGEPGPGCALALAIVRLHEARDSYQQLDALNARLLAWRASAPACEPADPAWRLVLADGLALAALHSGAPDADVDAQCSHLLELAAADSGDNIALLRWRLRAVTTLIGYTQLAGRHPLRVELDAIAAHCIAGLPATTVEIGRWWVERTLAEIFMFNTERRAEPPVATLLAATEQALAQLPDALNRFKHRRNQYEWARANKDLDAAARSIEAMREALVGLTRRSRALSIVLSRAKALLATEQGDAVAAERHVREAIAVADDIAAPANLRMSLWGSLASALSVQDRAADAASAAERAAGYASAQHRDVLLVIAELMHARARWATDYTAAVVHLRNALALARSIHYSQFLVTNAALAAWLVARALELGIEPAFAAGVIARRQLLPPPDAGTAWPWTVRIKLLGGWSIEGDAINLAGGKAQQKPLQVIQLLAIAGPKGLDRTKLARSVYGSAMLDSPATLNMAISRARRLLGDDSLIDTQGSRIRLDATRIHVDLWEMDALQPASGDEAAVQGRRLVELYGGALLQGSANALEHRLLAATVRDRFVALVATLSAAMPDADAVACLRRAIASEPAAEVLYRSLIERLAALGDAAEAITVYRQCEIVLDEAFGVAPSERTQRLIEAVRSRAATRLAPVVTAVRPGGDATDAAPARPGRRKSVG